MRVLISAILVLALAASASALTVVLQWDPVDAAGLTGYRVYYQAGDPMPAQPQLGAGMVNVGNVTTATIVIPPETALGRIWYFAVTALSAAGESGYSNIVSVGGGTVYLGAGKRTYLVPTVSKVPTVNNFYPVQIWRGAWWRL